MTNQPNDRQPYQQRRPLPRQPIPPPAPRPPKRQDDLTSGKMPRIFWVIVGASTVLAILIVLFLVLRGIQDGRNQGLAQERQQVAIYIQTAQDLLAEGDPQAALEAYRQVLILDPNNEEAIAGIGSLLNGDGIIAAATEVPPTPVPAPTATPTPLNSLAQIWGDAQALYSAGRWEEAIDRMRQVQASDPVYQKEEVEEMLYTAYVTLATEKSNSGSLEEAVRLFDRALEIRPDQTDIRALRNDTASYVDALTYWFADWPSVIELLSELYEGNPNYRDVRQRLQTAHVEYGDVLSRQGAWCMAAQEYDAAINVQNGPGLEAKQVEFETLCEEGVAAEDVADGAAPSSVIQDPVATVVATTQPQTNSQGLGVGRILYAAQDTVDGRYRIYAQPVAASVRPVVLVEDAMQVDLRPDGQRLALRNMRGDQRGLGSFDPGTGLRLRFTNFAEDSLPSWNPEGNRLVFASTREGDRRWRIYVAWADGNDNGSSVVFGQDPNWHPSQDLIVYKGCDERGNGCGIRTMNSAGGSQTPLTTVAGDGHPVWSPDGRYVFFMSAERHGNWEIYRVEVASGAVTRMTDNPAIDGIPTVSPDGSRMAFLSNRDGSWAIWIQSINGGPAQKLAALNGTLPDWLQATIRWVL